MEILGEGLGGCGVVFRAAVAEVCWSKGRVERECRGVKWISPGQGSKVDRVSRGVWWGVEELGGS